MKGSAFSWIQLNKITTPNITKTQMAPAAIWGIDYVSHAISSSVRLIEVIQEICMETSPD
jgi:hypothetical protein